MEIILVDDGSTDGTGKLCDELAKKDTRITVIHKENGGISSARNRGVREAKGEYVGFVDGDDYIEVTMYEQLVEAVLRTNACIAQIGRDEYDQNWNLLPKFCETPKEEVAITAKEFVKSLLLHKGDCSFCTKLIKRELFDYDEFPDGLLNEDFHLLMELLLKVPVIVSLPSVGYHIFCRLDSVSRRKDPNDFSRVFQDDVDNAFFALDIVKAHYPEFYLHAIRFGFAQRLDYMLHIPVGKMKRSYADYIVIRKYLRKNVIKMLKNPYLTKKEKSYLLVLTIAPKWIRRIHGWKMKFK